MSDRSAERDWKVFRKLREVALERLCERTLDELRTVIDNSATTHHERFRELFGLIDGRNHEIARAFDGPKRSSMIAQLSLIYSLGLLEAEEFARFSQETREHVESLAKIR